MILTHPALTKLTFMDYLLTMLRSLLRRKQGHDIDMERESPLPRMSVVCVSDVCSQHDQNMLPFSFFYVCSISFIERISELAS